MTSGARPALSNRPEFGAASQDSLVELSALVAFRRRRETARVRNPRWSCVPVGARDLGSGL